MGPPRVRHLCDSIRPHQQADNTYAPLGPDDLQSLVATVALYPDAMLAQILVACTYPNDIAAATQYLDAGNDPNAIDDQGWDTQCCRRRRLSRSASLYGQ